MIEEGEKIGEEYEQPLGYIVVPMGNLTDLALPTDTAIPIPRWIFFPKIQSCGRPCHTVVWRNVNVRKTEPYDVIVTWFGRLETVSMHGCSVMTQRVALFLTLFKFSNGYPFTYEKDSVWI